MASSRRTFLKVAGASLVGAGAAVPLLGAIARARAATPGTTGHKVRWAMVVDPRKCLGKDKCGACTSACHFVHNVPNNQGDPRHDVKWIWKEKFEHAFPELGHGPIGSHGAPGGSPFVPEWLRGQDMVVLCNQCERPPCVRVCPTQATFKRDVDGIVMMDEHRCIGCRYCMAACPYGSRSFNFIDPRPALQKEGRLHEAFPSRTKGVVEKCNFCADLLAEGKEPACVKTCREQGGGALVFGDLNDPGSKISEHLRQSYTIRRKLALGTEPHVFYLV